MSGRATTRRTRAAILAVTAALAVLWAAPALACPVCYGEAEGGVIDGTKMSVAFLGGLVYLLLFGGVGMAMVVRRRAMRASDLRHGLHLVPGTAGGDAAAAAGGDDSNEATKRHGGRREPAEETSER